MIILGNFRDHPLVIYAFSKQNNILKLVTEQTRSGTVCYNDTIMFYAGKDKLMFANCFLYNI